MEAHDPIVPLIEYVCATRYADLPAEVVGGRKRLRRAGTGG